MRRTPYTERGIRRLECFRAGCRNRAETQWQICADGNVYRPLCLPCNVELNRLVLEWAGLADAQAEIATYAASRGHYTEQSMATPETVRRFLTIMDAVRQAADNDGDFRGKTSYTDPEHPAGAWQVKLGGVWYDVHVEVSDA